MSARKDDDQQIVHSSGNVFADLGLTLTAEDEIKIEIAREITRVIQARRYTQTDVARRLGTTQARVSEITRGRLAGYSAERLFRYLLSLGVNVDIHLSDATGGDAIANEGQVRFHTPLAAACG